MYHKAFERIPNLNFFKVLCKLKTIGQINTIQTLKEPSANPQKPSKRFLILNFNYNQLQIPFNE